jgi:hypothetical protein
LSARIVGDGHLLELAGEISVFTPAEFLAAQDQKRAIVVVGCDEYRERCPIPRSDRASV